MRTFYASKISANISETPDGFMVCRNVPIARTGEYIYRAGELMLNNCDPCGKISVYRTDEAVFSPASMASFEGKPVTDEHPPEEVNPENAYMYVKGTASDVRRGEGADADKLVADLIIYDRGLITQIQRGKRDISCGYDFEKVIAPDGKIFQSKIVGNHIAVVSAGRAGDTVSIKDEDLSAGTMPALNIERRTVKKMKKKDGEHNILISAIADTLSMFPNDAAPEARAETLTNLVDAVLDSNLKSEDEAQKSAPPAEPPEPEKADNEAAGASPETGEILTVVKGMAERLKELSAEVAGLRAQKDEAEDPIAKLEWELAAEQPEQPEEDRVIGNLTAQQDEPLIIEEETQAIRNAAVPGEDFRQLALAMIRLIKPYIADEKDPLKRKMTSDSLAKFTRAAVGVRPPAKSAAKSDSYAQILETRRQTMRDSAKKHGGTEDLGLLVSDRFLFGGSSTANMGLFTSKSALRQ